VVSADGRAPFTFCFPQPFRLYLVARFVLKSRLELVRQKSPHQESVQRLARFATTTNSNASGPMPESHSISAEEAFLEVSF
jgi:hypothetical protein